MFARLRLPASGLVEGVVSDPWGKDFTPTENLPHGLLG